MSECICGGIIHAAHIECSVCGKPVCMTHIKEHLKKHSQDGKLRSLAYKSVTKDIEEKHGNFKQLA